MTIELKQAAQHALDALEARCGTNADERQPGGVIEALRTAIQQAESEPVGFVDFQGTVFWHDGPPPADSLLFAAKPVSHDKAKWCEYVAGMVFAWLEMQENLKEEDRCIKAIAGIIERRMWALSTHRPAPGVPDDVVRDAERLNELEALVQSKGTHGLSFDYCKHVEDGYVVEKGFRVMWRHHLGERKPTLREAIDAASPAQKGGE